MCLNTTEMAAETNEGPMKRQASCMDMVVELLTGVLENPDNICRLSLTSKDPDASSIGRRSL
jgi:hypothetical protein